MVLTCTRRICFNTCSSCEEQLDDHNAGGLMIPFQYMLLLRGATACRLKTTIAREFQYMLLLRGATQSQFALPVVNVVSIHAPLARSNLCVPQEITMSVFQYMLLLRGATYLTLEGKLKDLFQYMLLLRGATSGKFPAP